MTQDMKRNQILHTQQGIRNYVSRHVFIPTLGIKYSHTGNKIFPRWEFLRTSLLLLLMLLSVGINKAWGQGIYYIASEYDDISEKKQYKNGTIAEHFYLVPAEGENLSNKELAYYKFPDNGFTQPYITTFQTNQDNNSAWILKKTGNSYQIIHALTGKYMEYAIPDNVNPTRRVVHLVALTETEASANNNTLFTITTNDNNTNIVPNALSSESNKYLNVAGHNRTFYYAGNNKNYSEGLIGVWSEPTGLSIWHLEDALLTAPTINDVNDNGKVTVTENNDLLYEQVGENALDGYHVRYEFSTTGEPADPTASSPVMPVDGFPVTHEGDLKVVIERYGVVLTAVSAKKHVVPNTLTVSFNVNCDNELEIITSKAADNIHTYYTFTTDGTEPADPDNTSTEYTGTIPVSNLAEGYRFKAIAYEDEAPTEVSSFTYYTNTPAPTIAPLSTNSATVSFTGTATIYYTTNGVDPVIGEDGVTSVSGTNSVSIPISPTEDLDLRVIAKTGEHGPSCPVVVAKRPKQPTISTTIDCSTHTMTFTGTETGKTYWYALSNGSNQPAPNDLDSYTQYNGSAVDIANITGWPWDGSVYVTLHAYAKDAEGNRSVVVSQSGKLKYTSAPTIKVSGNTVTITAVAGAVIKYKINNGAEQTYGDPFPISNENQTITATAQVADEGLSCVTTYIYKKGHHIIALSEITTLDEVYYLDNDIENAGTSPLTGTFTGTIDGQMHTISGLSSALVNIANGATIKNVILKDVQVSSGSTAGNVGAICNEATGATRIYNCGVLGTITETKTKDPNTGVVTNINVSGSSTISGSNYVGSIVGLLDGTSRVINCYSYAVIGTGGNRVGGIVGYNNVSTTASNLKTMVMNCMFYGDIIGGSSDDDRNAPIYNGKLITNAGTNGVGNYNYFRAEARYVQDRRIKVYNCALAAEERYLNRFEFFRHLLNSNRALAAWWATDDRKNKDEMMKWELETADRTIVPTTENNMRKPYPYPVLKPVFDVDGKIIKHPTVVNIDAKNAPVFTDATKKLPYNEGCQFGAFEIKIRMGSKAAKQMYDAPNGAKILDDEGHEIQSNTETRNITVNITDKDPERYNFNYYKVQLPYYNDYGTKNYTGNRVVTGWKIVEVSDGGSGSFTTGSDAEANTEGKITSSPYNFADRKCSKKDLYTVSERIFNQGAYYDVPEGVTSITIEPYWAQAVYVSDPYLDKVYNTNMTEGYNVGNIGGGQRYTNNTAYDINGSSQMVYTSMSDAVEALNPEHMSSFVYDNAIVLVGNVHSLSLSSERHKFHYTIMSIDQDKDNEPDYSYILRFNGRARVHPVRVDFLNVIGLGMAQKSAGGTGTYNFGIMQPFGWFEVTNTALFRVTQFEYDFDGRDDSPMILQGGVIEQWVTVGGRETSYIAANSVSYYHVGGNVWFKEFHIGVHQDKIQDQFVSPHPPISVTGGDFDSFYLTGYYNSPNNNYPDNAECYINGGHFGKVAGTGMQGIGTPGGADDTGNIIWQIDNADIDEFYAGGINYAHVAEGNITTVISNSRVDLFCGGPKFGHMNSNKKVVTNATNCTFRTFFGAGYGGNAYNRRYPTNYNNVQNINWDDWVQNGATIDKIFFEGYNHEYSDTYKGIATRIDYQFLPMSGNTSNVARLFVDYVSFSKATTHDVTSNLTNCTITTKELGGLDLFEGCLGNFYGGGSLGKVEGPVKSKLTNCTVDGNVYGAGYSATLPPVSVMVKTETETGFKWFLNEPYYDGQLGAYLEAKLPATVSAQWVSGESDYYDDETDPDHPIIYTTADLTGLGTVTGDVTLTINGDQTDIKKCVYGGGEDSAVGGNTYVTMNDGKVGVNVYGGGKTGTIGTFTTSTNETGGKEYNFDEDTGICNVTINGGTVGPSTPTTESPGNVFGGGQGEAKIPEHDDEAIEGAFMCEAAMVDETKVIINNGTVNGTVYGGGELGRVNHDTEVTIGLASGTSTPVIEGSVYGAGKGVATHGYSALVRGNSTVTIQSDAKVKQSVYGGGEIASVGKYSLNESGEPVSLANQETGYCTVTIKGNAIIGPDAAMSMITESGYPDDAGHVFGGGMGVLPYEGVTGGVSGEPWRMQPDNKKQIFTEAKYVRYDTVNDDPDYKIAYLNFIETLALATQTYVTISGNALVKGSVYGGSMNGHVQHDTQVTIAEKCQIGWGENETEKYTEEQWAAENPSDFSECAHWEFEPPYAPYDIYDLDSDDKPKPATDGHTFYGNVFGGGSGYYPYARRDAQELAKLRALDAGYSDGLWHRDAGSVDGNTVVNITGGHILTSVYGGNECTDVAGSCTINMSGGTVGVPRNFETNPNNRLVTCYVFGGGKGDPRINFNQWTNVASASVNISGTARIFGSTFGGGEDGHVLGNVETNITAGEVINGIQYPYIGTTGTSGADGNVFGGGRGFSEAALTAGAVCGNVDVNISGGTMLGSVFGGGRLAPVGTHIVLAEDPNYGKLIRDQFDQSFAVDDHGNYIDIYKQLFDEYGNEKEDDDDTKYMADVESTGAEHGHITVNISGGVIGSSATATSSIGEVFGGCKGTSSQDPEKALRFGLSKTSEVTISQANEEFPTHIYNNVFGGGEAGNVKRYVYVTINGGTIDKDVYGGGKKASTNYDVKDMLVKEMTDPEKDPGVDSNTTVNLHGGTIKGDVYGGGLGTSEIPAIVGGNVTVNMNYNNGCDNDTEDKDNCVVQGTIFGCNNVNGTPRGNVEVNIYKTVGDKRKGDFELKAVYGGGNEAAYEPTDAYDAEGKYIAYYIDDSDKDNILYKPCTFNEDTGEPEVIDGRTPLTRISKANVNIYGCDLTSIKEVYGGGNSAPTPATCVTVNGCFEIGTVFGGGNGADDLANGTPNLGANVGYRNYSYSVDTGETDPETGKEIYNRLDYDGNYPQSNPYPPASTKKDRRNNYSYGTGKAETRLYGGTINQAFGGSNTLGNVREVAFSVLDQQSTCALEVGQIYGAGNKAYMDAKIELDLGCISGFKELFGGAFNADINEDVNLKVTSGTFGSIYGGNNVGGQINGTITVEVEETGCQPVIIGKLYGGGKLADYTAPAGRENSPIVRVKSATHIGTVYGGGFQANVTGNPTVEINMVKGILNYLDDDATNNEEQNLGTVDNVFGGGFEGWVKGNTKVLIGTLPNKSAVITGNVFGGGDNADVIGKTNVQIGYDDLKPTTQQTTTP
jgi:hypothetical protein